MLSCCSTVDFPLKEQLIKMENLMFYTFKQKLILSPYLLFIDDFDSQTMCQNGIPDNKNLSKFLAATLNIYQISVSCF